MPSGQEIEAYRRAHRLPGLAIALVDGESFRTFTAGWADRERELTVAADTRFRTGSWTKLLTAIAALQLQEQGQVDLDTGILRWLPELSRTPWARQTTLRHLLAHSSGLPRGLYRTRPWTEPELLELAGCCEPVAAAGQVRKYSNLGVALASVLLGRAAGRAFDSWIGENIFRRLELTGSTIDTAGTDLDLTIGYEAGHYRSLVGPGHTLRPAETLAEMPGAGGFCTTAEDLGILLRAVLARDRALLKPESWDDLHSGQPPPGSAAFGLGLRIQERWGRRFFWHSGGAAGFSTFWSFCPDSRIAAAAMTNRCGAEPLLLRLLDQLLRPRLPPASLRRRPNPIASQPPRPRWPLYTGRYRCAEREIRVLDEDRSLVFREGSSRTLLRPWRRHSFTLDEGPYRDHLLRFRVEQGLVFEAFLGPWHLVRASPFSFLFHLAVRPPRRSLSPRARACAGIYHHPNVGPVAVFLRPSGLVFSFSFAEESTLEPIGRNDYRIRGGTFSGEAARFCFAQGRPVALEAGLLRFERRSDLPGRAPTRW